MDPMNIISNITGAISLYKTAVEMVDQAKIDAASKALNVELINLGAEVIAMQKKELESTERERSLLREKNDLADQVKELEKRIADRGRYDLVEDYPGTFTLRIKESYRHSEPIHHLCPGCMDNRQVKSILQFNNPDKAFAYCPECKTMYEFGGFQAPNRPYHDPYSGI